jgi:hypothetical protein
MGGYSKCGKAAKEFSTMKNKLSIILGVLLVLGLFFTACDDGFSSDNDPFNGTWTATNTPYPIMMSGANGAWKYFEYGVETVRGTYTYSGNVVTAKIIEVNPIVFGRTGPFIKYSDLSNAEKANLLDNTDTFMVTIVNNTFSAMGATFRKQ